MILKSIFRYINIVHDYVYYRKVYYINSDNIPPDGSSVIVVSNHQNAINDPLALEFCFRKRHFHIFARASLFASRFGNWFFRGLGVLPAFRLRTDGEESLKNNYGSFTEAGGILANGGMVGIFPEGTNQYRHWLGDFSQAYLRLAFETAKRCGFNREIYILPVSVHYSDYFKFRADMMVVCGEPLALSQYYGQYESKPRTTCRTVNDIIHERVRALMLDIRDEENYAAVEYLLGSYGNSFARDNGFNPRILPEKLRSDQILAKKLGHLAAANPDKYDKLCNDALLLEAKTSAAGLRDGVFDHCPSLSNLIFKGLAFLLLFPMFAIGLYPNILCYFAPMPLVNKLKKMGGPFTLFQSGIQLGINALAVVPLSYLAVFIADVCFCGWLFGFVHLLLLPVLGMFSWDYSRQWKKFMGQIRFRLHGKSEQIREIESLRAGIFKTMDAVSGTNDK